MNNGCRILVGSGEGRETLERFYELLRSQCIVDSARRVLQASQSGDFMKFELNKQAAFMGVVNFSKPGTAGVGGLGTLEVEIHGINGVANWLAP